MSVDAIGSQDSIQQANQAMIEAVNATMAQDHKQLAATAGNQAIMPEPQPIPEAGKGSVVNVMA